MLVRRSAGCDDLDDLLGRLDQIRRDRRASPGPTAQVRRHSQIVWELSSRRAPLHCRIVPPCSGLITEGTNFRGTVVEVATTVQRRSTASPSVSTRRRKGAMIRTCGWSSAW